MLILGIISPDFLKSIEGGSINQKEKEQSMPIQLLISTVRQYIIIQLTYTIALRGVSSLQLIFCFKYMIICHM